MTDSPLDVELSVVNTNNRELLLGCLRTVESACRGLTWCVTVIENASTDGSAEAVAQEFPWARVLQNDRRLGFSANHNQVLIPAVRDGTSRYVLILNEDTELGPGAVAEMVAFADREPRAGAVAPNVQLTDGGSRRSLYPFPTVLDQFWGALRPPGRPRKNPEVGWLNGSCVLLRTAALREIGTLDERFFIFYEDTDLGMRLHRSGWRSLVCPEASIVHREHATVGDAGKSDSMERQLLRSRFLYFEKHRGRRVALVLSSAIRIALLLRSTRAGVGRTDLDRAQASALFSLARYDPRVALPHELLAHAK